MAATRRVRPTGPRATSADDTLVDSLVQTSFVTMAVLTRVAAENDLSLTQLRVLAILRDRRPRMSALAAYLGLEKSTMSGLVDRAEMRGVLGRAPSPADGRAVEVFLTAPGGELAARLHAQVAEALAPSLGTLTRSDQRRLQELLGRTLVTPGPDTGQRSRHSSAAPGRNRADPNTVDR